MAEPSAASSTPVRDQGLDAARGLGILVVVLGHNMWVIDHAEFVYAAAYAFSVPLFFLLSGVFHRPGRPWRQVLVNKSRHILVPYAVMASGVALLAYPPGHWVTAWSGVLVAHGDTLRWVPLWFLPHLMVVILFVQALPLYKVDRPRKARPWYGAFLVAWVAGSLWVGHVPVWEMGEDAVRMEVTGLPWSLGLLPLTALFYFLGWRIGQGDFPGTNPPPWCWIPAGGVLLGLALWAGPTLDLHLRLIEGPFISLLNSVAGMIFTLGLAQVLASVPLLGAVLGRIGQASLWILILHTPFQHRATLFVLDHLESWSLAVPAGVAAGTLAGWGVHEVLHHPRVAALLKGPRAFRRS